MPIASAAAAIVLAVYMPPQAPSPGQIARSMASTSARVISPRAQAPTASNASMIVTSLSPTLAGQDRPGVEEDGGDVEARGGHEHRGLGLVAAGEQHARRRGARPRTRVSTESAMTSRLTSE